MKRILISMALTTLSAPALAAAPTEKGIKKLPVNGYAACRLENLLSELEIKTREVKNVVIFDLEGDIITVDANEALTKKTGEMIKAGKNRILINLANVSRINSAGIGTLVSAFTTANKAGGTLKLLHLTTKIRDLLAITKLLTVFHVFDNEADAIESFDTTPLKNKPSASKANINKPRLTALQKEINLIIMDVLGVRQRKVVPRARFREDLGADSLDELEMVLRFEEKFEIEIFDEDIAKIRTVKDAYDYIARAIEKKDNF